jgi:hypothetical protein
VRPRSLPASRPGAVQPLASTSGLVYLGPFYIVNQGTNRCLDAFYSYGGGNGNPVGLWDCNKGISEIWHWYKRYDLGYFEDVFINARSGRSLDYPEASGGRVGYRYQLWDYYPSAGQQFRLENVASGLFNVRNLRGDGVMDAYESGGGGNGNPVGMWWTTFHPLQRWQLLCSYSAGVCTR